MKFEQLQRLDKCLNCGAEEVGNFCPQCGQENEDKTTSVRSLVRDFLADVASFDSKLVHTIVPLLIRPGFLTNEYNQGKRVRYLAPVKMYVVMSLVFFLVLSRGISKSPVKFNSGDIASELSKTKVQGGTKIPAELSDGIVINGRRKNLPPTEAEYVKNQNALPATERDSPMERFFITRTYKAKSDPNSLVRQIMDNVPKGMFVLLPVFALILKLIYIRSKRLYVEHLIFSLHCHAFVFLIFTLDFWMPEVFRVISTVWMLVYLFLAMKNVYGQGFIKTSIKFLILKTLYFTILSLVLAGTFILSMAMLG